MNVALPTFSLPKSLVLHLLLLLICKVVERGGTQQTTLDNILSQFICLRHFDPSPEPFSMGVEL